MTLFIAWSVVFAAFFCCIGLIVSSARTDPKVPSCIRQLEQTIRERTSWSFDELSQVLHQAEIDSKALNAIAAFNPKNYNRISLVECGCFEILLLCWLPGQKSLIHNHKGSLCCVRVIEGEATEDVYCQHDDGSFDVSSQDFSADDVFGGEDDDIHTLANPKSADENLVTLHIYLPQLDEFEVFDESGGKLVQRC